MLREGLPEDLEKDAEEEVQKIVNDFTGKVDRTMAQKEKEVMTV